MTLQPNPPQRALRLHRDLDAIWCRPRGLRGWLSSVNHTELGLRFMITAFVFFGIGGLLAMLIRAQLATQGGAFLDAAHFNQIFTMHGSLMMFLFAIPMLEGLAMFLLPKMLGSRDLAFPRLSALGWWCYVLGGLILLAALLGGVAPDGGWFMYTPLSSRAYSPGINADVWLLGITFVEVSAIAAAVEITVTILRMRAPGMALTKMPLFAWYMLGTAAMMLVGFPPLILGSVLLELERAFDWPFFDVARGGDPLLWQHLFWLFGHPEVYIIFLPAAGAISTIIPVMSRVPIMGYGAIVAAILGLVFLSFGLWVHHMFTVGIPHLALAFFSSASALVAVPTAVQIFAWIGTMWRGKPQMRLPMLYLMGFFSTFVMGGLTGVMLAIVPFNWQVHDTAFVTAHLHYVLIGGFVFPMLAAVSYWMPLITGKLQIKSLGQTAFVLIFIGFHGTFFLMHLTGLLGMPRRIDIYPDNSEWVWLNLISSVFGFVMAMGFALFAISLALQVLFGTRARRDPWQAETLEWAAPLPAPSYNFASLPLPGQQGALPLARGEGLLPGAPRPQRETLVVDSISGAPRHVAVLPGNTLLPLVTAGMICAFVLLMLAGLYAVAPLALVGLIVAAWQWHHPAPLHGAPEVKVGPELSLPLHPFVADPLSRTGMTCLLIANGSIFACYLFALGFLSVIAPAWPAPESQVPQIAILPGLVIVAALAAAAALARIPQGAGAMAALALLGVAALALVVMVPLLDDPRLHARDALRAAAMGYVALHVIVGAVLSALCLVQRRDGRISALTSGATAHWRMWLDFSAVTAGIVLALISLQQVLA
ncbi:cytochrome c oxidase subunit I [Ketogulonicigenium vulgare]|uniref:cytochrome-c oxidase n=1 Tax=Ketogulonicigenium vulgare (strain WSH-001) TaxID=759362 RepID=F9Y913_KETVW|nr:cytochrome c oxidase subunit I [Ketogulonicigenium vulgare]ADO41845.1 cytochrome-c oxidase [Ketogulonicigenium vulgare Y25]AEM40069.1 cytochrome c oxidase subunit I [Ketogulonicigenium vulgare WSH-001]ALJ80273.1 cytochrome B [Ketogulonicigenium vulgare]ANW33127.1 cytochrome c oxidase subunit I [Ketogulonicigenium vulgare]AOZ53768.1 QoxA, Quinol oxidase subunit I [Ketogulonicigenium vulgare]